MKQTSVLAILLLICFYSHGQSNDSTHYYAQIISTGSYNYTNNIKTVLLNNQVNLSYKIKALSLNTDNSWLYGTQQGAYTNNDYNFLLDCDVYKLLPHAYYWGFTSYTSSFSLKIRSLYQAGAGIAYNVIDHKHFKFNLSDGVLYENSDIVPPDSIESMYHTYRNSFRVMVNWDTGIVSLKSIFFIQNSFSNQTDYIVKAAINVSIKVEKWLAFTLAYVYNKFNRTNAENSLFTYGLTISRNYR